MGGPWAGDGRAMGGRGPGAGLTGTGAAVPALSNAAVIVVFGGSWDSLLAILDRLFVERYLGLDNCVVGKVALGIEFESLDTDHVIDTRNRYTV